MNDPSLQSSNWIELTPVSSDPTINIPVCKYCLEEDDRENLIMPCNCSGTQAFVHRACLNLWRSDDRSQPKFSKCLICNTDYEYIKYEDQWNGSKIKIMIILWICIDIIIILTVLSSFVTVLAVLSWLTGLCDEIAYKWNVNIIIASMSVGIIELFVLIAWMGLLVVAFDVENIPMYFCLSGNDNKTALVIVLIFALFGAIIGIAACIRVISRRIIKRSEKYKQKLLYVVADRA
jgi:hypothetical protein